MSQGAVRHVEKRKCKASDVNVDWLRMTLELSGVVPGKQGRERRAAERGRAHQRHEQPQAPWVRRARQIAQAKGRGPSNWST